MAEQPTLAESMRRATAALNELVEALKPKTYQEYLEWLRYNDPLRYIFELHHTKKRTKCTSRLLRGLASNKTAGQSATTAISAPPRNRM